MIVTQDAPLSHRREDVDRDILKLSEALLLCQRELEQVRLRQEEWFEQSAEARTECREAKETAAFVSKSLADQLSRSFWEQQQPSERIGWRRFIGSRWPWARQLFGGRRSRADLELQQRVTLIESSTLFQPDWYLRNNSDVALAGINPAVHYLQAGAQEGRDPGPEFDTRAYLLEHPDVAQGHVNPLVHHLQTQPDEP